MRIVVTGASGFLGYHLTRFLEAHEAEVCGLWRHCPVSFEKSLAEQADLADPAQVNSLLSRWSPTHIIHCAALTSTPVCEANPEVALRENFTATQNLVSAANEKLRGKPHFVFISTDLVFDGSKGFYREEDEPAPIMVYGKTKRAAEQAVELTYEGNWAIIRSALIYGLPTPAGRGSFLNWLLDGLRNGRCRLFTDEYRSPIAVDDLCWLIYEIIRGQHVGYWHAGGPQRLSRYEIGKLAAYAFGLPESNIEPASLASVELPAPRPPDVSLDITKARTQLGFNPAPMGEKLKTLVAAMGSTE